MISVSVLHILLAEKQVWHHLVVKRPVKTSVLSRFAHSAFTIGTKLYLFGGYSQKSEKYLNDLCLIDLTSISEDEHDLSMSRHSSFSETGEIENDNLLVCEEVKCDGDQPSARAAFSACVYAQNQLWIFGGNNKFEFFNDMFKFDFAT